MNSTGIKVTNRGQWMDEKWNTQNRKKYIKIDVAVDVKNKEILALEVTNQKVHDGRMLKKLVDHVLDSSSSESNMVKVNCSLLMEYNNAIFSISR